MFTSPSKLSEESRVKIADTLNARLADGLDLHGQIKVAHWNVKGPQFAALHPLFESFAEDLAAFNDEVAERVVTLGARALGTARHVAAHSQLAEYPQETSRAGDHVRLLADRFDRYLEGVRGSRTSAEKLGDVDSVDLLTRIASTFEKHGWFLRASLEG